MTDAIIRATEPSMCNSILKRATFAYETLKNGKTLEELVKKVQERHIATIADGTARIMSKALNRNIEYIKFKEVKPGAGRRTHKFAKRYFAFDGYVDVEVKVDGKVHRMKNLLADVAPKALLSGDKETMSTIATVSMAVTELLNSGACSMDVAVCACMAAAMGMDPKEAAERSAEAANVIISMPWPGLKNAAQLAAEIVKELQ